MTRAIASYTRIFVPGAYAGISRSEQRPVTIAATAIARGQI
ncbi:MAG: hypothetical protein ACLQMF_07610 [Rectinemataceae bacterium]